MSTVMLAPPNAILFVFDRGDKSVRIPDYIDGQLVASNDSCVSIGTQAAVDGDVTVTLEAASSPSLLSGLQNVFAGVVHAPSHKLAIVSADGQTVLESDVASDRPRLEIWADDLRNPARIAVVAR